ncbi:MAG: glycyl-radical enzyme activating protein [Prevotellaceae bacterium]|jgi:pyruvate formate lyase activating enzyme|nr:glycyl-radical enzyme activating protein [Prevotellaceae bacterium]
MPTALLFDIKRYAINDGPGIRITLFFKGCPLSCVWCHNPEGISPAPQRLFTRGKCIGCNTCVEQGPEACPTRAREMSGRPYSVDELMREIVRETIVMDRSGGGVTFCGGEPLMQPVVLLELLRRCGLEGIHRAVDTTLYASPATVDALVPHTDLFLVDLKHMDSALHRTYCGVPNDLILDNIRRVAASGRAVEMRIPLVAGVNADDGNLRATARFLASLARPDITVKLLPYHDVAGSKHEKLGTVYNPHGYPLSKPSPDSLARIPELFAREGITAVVG